MPFRNTTCGERSKIIDEIENNIDLKGVQVKYKVSRSSVYRFLNSKDTILKAIENDNNKRKR